MSYSRTQCAGVFVFSLLGILGSAVRAEQESWPRVEQVQRQPMLAQIRRLIDAAEHLGHPLDHGLVQELQALHTETDQVSLAHRLQQALDPLCVAVVTLNPEGPPQVVSSSRPVETVEQGWRSVLVKVINLKGSRARLRVESPQAKPIPHGPAEEVESRWLSLMLPSGQPLSANLSGNQLEYRWMEVYSREAGERFATLEFAAPDPSESPSIRGESSIIAEWRFDRDTAGWEAMNQVELQLEKSSLRVKGTGDDPFMGTQLDHPVKSGSFVFRFWARAEEPGVGQLFWSTEARPQPDGAHQISFPLESGQEALYEIPFSDESDLIGLRLDPNGVPGNMRIDWMELSYAGRGNEWGKASIPFRTLPATPVTFRIQDDPDRPAMACFEITDEQGRIQPPQSKRLAPDFFFQKQIYRGDGESIRLPAGRYTIRCSRGPESIPEVHSITVGDEPIEFHYQVKRWVDPSRRGYWSGDHHIHAAGCAHYENPTQGVMPADMLRHCMGEDLKVGCCLTWGPCFDFQKRFFSGRPDDQSRYPYLLRYDVEVSGFGSHQSGHLNLLRLQQQIPPGGDSKEHWPTLGLNTLRWAKRQGAICGPAHSAIGLTRIIDRLANSEGREGPGRLPNYDIPAFDGIGANEFIMNVAHVVPGPDDRLVPAVDFISTMNTDRIAEWNLWYHVLNCGLKIRASGETDFPCISGERVGMGRVYVKLDGPLEFNAWCDGLAAGRSYISDGLTHLMDFRAIDSKRNLEQELGVEDGECEIDRGDKLMFAINATARYDHAPSTRVELIVNGYPVSSQEISADGSLHDLVFEHRFDRSSWVAVRVLPGGHTNPIFVSVEGQPILEPLSAAWCLRCVEICQRAKLPLYDEDEREQAEADYQHALEFFRRLANP